MGQDFGSLRLKPALQVLVVGDVHIDQGSWAGRGKIGKAAWESATACWRAAVDQAIERKVDAFCLAGDAFRNHQPSAEAVELIADGIRDLSKAGITSVVLPGNHELHGLPAGHRHALDRLADIPLVSVVNEVGVVCVNDLQIACVPWPRRVGDAARLGVNVAEVEAAVSRRVAEDIDRLAESVRFDQPSLLIGHLLADTVRFGGGAGRGSEMAMAANLVEPVVSVAQLESLFPMAVLAHVHRRQKLGKAGKVFYTGSTDAHDISDEGQEKAASLVCFDTAGVPTMHALPLPARSFTTIDVDLDSPEEVAAACKAVRDGDLVRLRWSGGDRVSLGHLAVALEEAGAVVVATAAPLPKHPVRQEGDGLAAEVGVTEALRTWAEKAGYKEDLIVQLLGAAEKVIAKVDQT
jgi:DNA repair exonuclease SbcCD nuclease subunit